MPVPPIVSYYHHASPAGKTFTKAWEELRLVTYCCIAGVPTVGWGHTGYEVGSPATKTTPVIFRIQTITLSQAEAFFEHDVKMIEIEVNKMLKWRNLTPAQFDVLVDFAFNFGTGALAGSTLMRMLNDGMIGSVPYQLKRWINAKDPKTGELRPWPGLINRREAEIKRWNLK